MISKLRRNKKGQSFIELVLMMPLLLLFVLGAIEVVNVVDNVFIMIHLTREAANMTSRGTAVSSALEAVVKSSSPVVYGIDFNADGEPEPNTGNWTRWKIVHSRVGSPADPVNPAGCTGVAESYVVLEQTEWGGLGATSEVGPGGVCSTAILPDLEVIGGGLDFNAVEVFFDYTPITPLGNFGVDFMNHRFYQRAVF